jgi:uncharacterized membrane protein YoaK (UPF0700 family)
MDARVYLAHGQVLANAQSGNIVLIGIALAGGDVARAATDLPPLLAFVAGMLASRLSGHLLKRNCVGFIMDVQITSLSHIGSWSFNTGMATGNLHAGVSALVKTLTGSAEKWPRAGIMCMLCLAFAVGAAVGAWLAPRLGEATLVPVAALIATAAAAGPSGLDPVPDWTDLK